MNGLAEVSSPRCLATPWTAKWQLRSELARLVEPLGALLQCQRARGRTPAGDAVEGLVIEDGEAEGLLSHLAATWSPELADQPATAGYQGSRRRAAIDERAEMGVAHGVFLPLRHAAQVFDLHPAEYDALILALAVEVDSRFGRLVAYLNDHVARTRPTLGLGLALTQDGHTPIQQVVADLIARPIFRDGLLDLDGDGPLPGLTLRVAPDMLSRLLATDDVPRPAPAHVGIAPPLASLLDHLILDDQTRSAVSAWADQARARPDALNPMLIAGAAGCGASSLAHAAASRTGRVLVAISPPDDHTHLAATLRAARREARWHQAVLSLDWSAAAAEAPVWRTVWHELQTLRLPLVMIMSPSQAAIAAERAPREPLVIELPLAPPRTRAVIWRALLPPGTTLGDDDLSSLASRFRFHPGRIARAIRLATVIAARRELAARHLTAPDLESACRTIGSIGMSALAQRLPLPYDRNDLVVPSAVSTELDLAVSWVRHREKVLDGWGFGRRVVLGRGLAALFAGKPGTGKTMAAQVLARELGCDLYRVDLSRVMSKYIGETEKQLAQLFDEAQAAGVVLFFDEADALFGKRTEVKDAHDRYANVEIGYLLQRMEEYDGVTILATNRMRDLDEAFVRRISVIIQFPVPEAAERLRLWQGMLPAEAECEHGLDVAPLARQFELSGGEIRNAVLAAAYLAAGAGQSIGMSHLKKALRRELSRSGRVLSHDESTALQTDSDWDGPQ